MRSWLAHVAIVAIVAMLVLSVGAAAGTPTYGATIRAGDCKTPGEVVTSLPGLSVDVQVGTAAPAGLRSAAEALGGRSVLGPTTVPMSLAEIAAADHAIDVSAASGGEHTLVACGELAHFEPGPADVQVGLGEREGTTTTGVAWLHDNGDGTTAVTVVLRGAAEATTASTDREAAAVVTISKSRYLPSPLEIAAGTTVTWTNEDLLPHTTTATEGGFDSGYMVQGDTFSHTFDTPGTYPIFCLYHPRMRATVIVS